MDIIWQANENISFLSSYIYTDAIYIKDKPKVHRGRALAHIPKHATRFWGNYRFSQPFLQGLSLGAGIYTQSGVYLDTLALQRSKSFYSIDASLHYEIEIFKISASIKNLTNKQYFESLNYFGGRLAPAQPISAYVGI